MKEAETTLPLDYPSIFIIHLNYTSYRVYWTFIMWLTIRTLGFIASGGKSFMEDKLWRITARRGRPPIPPVPFSLRERSRTGCSGNVGFFFAKKDIVVEIRSTLRFLRWRVIKFKQSCKRLTRHFVSLVFCHLTSLAPSTFFYQRAKFEISSYLFTTIM